MVRPAAGFLMWVDFRRTRLTHEQIGQKLLDEARLVLEDGARFGMPRAFRLNFACSRVVLSQALDRIAEAFSGH